AWAPRGGGNPRRVQQRTQTGQLAAQPAQRVGGQSGDEGPAAWVPAGECRMVVGAVEAARPARYRFEQIGPPDRRANLDGLRRVDRSLQLAAAEHPPFAPDAALR